VLDGQGNVVKFSSALKEKVLEENLNAAEEGLRCLALAFKEDSEERDEKVPLCQSLGRWSRMTDVRLADLGGHGRVRRDRERPDLCRPGVHA
jgi:hypothetical protein